MRSYLEQLAVSSRPSTVEAASLALRHLAAHLTESDPTCTSVAAIERRHIEAYKIALAKRPGAGANKTVSSTTIRHNLGMARTFFERIIDWDYPDAPRRVPIFTGDLPKADEPAPKFLDDPTAAKFMAALATDPNRRRRLIVELLARTGMRAGELGGLRDDAMYRLGDTHWLRIPPNSPQRAHVPLHPLLLVRLPVLAAHVDTRAASNATITDPFDRLTIHTLEALHGVDVSSSPRPESFEHISLHPHCSFSPASPRSSHSSPSEPLASPRSTHSCRPSSPACRRSRRPSSPRQRSNDLRRAPRHRVHRTRSLLRRPLDTGLLPAPHGHPLYEVRVTGELPGEGDWTRRTRYWGASVSETLRVWC